jgi:DNA-binding PadR family transcriptional regulator
MRLLFLCDKDFNNLLSELDLAKIELVNVVQYLEKNRLIKKKMNEDRFVYSLTKRGKIRLAYWEWRWQLYTCWKTPWSDSFNDFYYEEMKRIIIEDLRLPT